MFNSKTILVTGGTGSFGSTIVRKMLADSEIEEIRILSRDEKKQEDLRNELNDSRVKFYIGDVRERDSVKQAIDGADFVFHAAALKQVPSCEFHPSQALRTNVLGAENVVITSQEVGVERVVFLSTDKAVNPINVMGMTKALMEKLVLAKSRFHKEGGPILSCTRYGNVMYSRGSVIPLFIKQIKAGKPLTITDPNMTRFMMSLDDSVDLVLYALQHATPGDTFVQKSPAATIQTLAVALHELFEQETKIKVVGVRHGEKIHETLLSQEEVTRASDLGRYYRIPLDERDLNYGSYTDYGDQGVVEHKEYNSENTHRLDVEGMKDLLLSLNSVREQLRG